MWIDRLRERLQIYMDHQLWVEIPRAFSIPSIHCAEQEMVAAIFKILSKFIFQNKVNCPPYQVKNNKKSLSASASASTRWPLISGTFPLKSDRDIGKLSAHSRWSLIAGAAEDRFYCSAVFGFLSVGTKMHHVSYAFPLAVITISV